MELETSTMNQFKLRPSTVAQMEVLETRRAPRLRQGVSSHLSFCNQANNRRLLKRIHSLPHLSNQAALGALVTKIKQKCSRCQLPMLQLVQLQPKAPNRIGS